MALTLAQLATELDAQLHGDGDIQVSGLGTLKSAGANDLTFLANPKYRPYLEQTRAAAVLCTPDQVAFSPVAALAVKDPYLAFARVTRHFDRTPVPPAGIHPTAVVAASARVDASASVGAHAVIEDDAVIGAGAVVMANVFVGARSSIGAAARLWPGVVVYHDVTLGARVNVHANTVIGSDGFGFAPSKQGWIKISQVGGVRIGDDSDIGACTTIDRGAIEDTVIGKGVIIDNQVQVAHNVVIGDHTALAGKVGISGSSRIGSRCMLGGAVGVAGHLEIVDDVQVLGMSLVSGSITKPGIYASGTLLDEHTRWRKNTVRTRQLDELFRRVRQLEKARDQGQGEQ